MIFEKSLQKRKKEVEDHLYSYFENFKGFQKTVYQAMDYSLKAGGKRLRPVLLLEACMMFGGKFEDAIEFACALEMIHTYSLIHDDLPAMDDDDYRRGKPTNHIVYGEGTAILAGDGLLNSAFEIMISKALEIEGQSSKYLMAMKEIATAAGVKGMIGGQIVDLESENKTVSLETVDFIHNHKTGTMIKASLVAGAIIGGADEKGLQHISKYGENIGLAFQIIDDILDIVGDQQKLGKDIGSDAEKQKSTYPNLLGLENSREKALELLEESKQIIEIYNEKAAFLKSVADFLANREF